MREIKFRGWLSHSRKMTYAHTLDELMNWNTKPEDNGAAIWLQYTGMKDKNGKEIYEGDLFKRDGYWATFKVVFAEGCFMLENHGMLYPMYQKEIYDEMTEILGNIYENKAKPLG